MSALKWSLLVLALTALLSSQSCSAYRADIFSEFVEPWPTYPDDHVPTPRPGPAPSPASGPYPPMPADSRRTEPSLDRTAPPPPKEEITAALIPAMRNGISMNCGRGCGGWDEPDVGCGGPPCVPPPKNPFYCQPAACTAYPGCGVGAGAGHGFTIYMDDHFVAAVSSSGNEQKP